jgi:hypothetical protein
MLKGEIHSVPFFILARISPFEGLHGKLSSDYYQVLQAIANMTQFTGVKEPFMQIMNGAHNVLSLALLFSFWPSPSLSSFLCVFVCSCVSRDNFWRSFRALASQPAPPSPTYTHTHTHTHTNTHCAYGDADFVVEHTPRVQAFLDAAAKLPSRIDGALLTEFEKYQIVLPGVAAEEGACVHERDGSFFFCS